METVAIDSIISLMYHILEGKMNIIISGDDSVPMGMILITPKLLNEAIEELNTLKEIADAQSDV